MLFSYDSERHGDKVKVIRHVYTEVDNVPQEFDDCIIFPVSMSRDICLRWIALAIMNEKYGEMIQKLCDDIMAITIEIENETGRVKNET